MFIFASLIFKLALLFEKQKSILRSEIDGRLSDRQGAKLDCLPNLDIFSAASLLHARDLHILFSCCLAHVPVGTQKRLIPDLQSELTVHTGAKPNYLYSLWKTELIDFSSIFDLRQSSAEVLQSLASSNYSKCSLHAGAVQEKSAYFTMTMGPEKSITTATERREAADWLIADHQQLTGRDTVTLSSDDTARQ